MGKGRLRNQKGPFSRCRKAKDRLSPGCSPAKKQREGCIRLEDDNQVVDGELREQAIGEPEEPIVEGHPINTKHSRPKAIIGEVEGVLFVVFTMEEGPDWKATRIISARAADEDEVKAYFDWKYGS